MEECLYKFMEGRESTSAEDVYMSSWKFVSFSVWSIFDLIALIALMIDHSELIWTLNSIWSILFDLVRMIDMGWSDFLDLIGLVDSIWLMLIWFGLLWQCWLGACSCMHAEAWVRTSCYASNASELMSWWADRSEWLIEPVKYYKFCHCWWKIIALHPLDERSVIAGR